MKVLVTGAEGFIGSHLVEKLILLGAKVRALKQYHFQNYDGCLENLSENILKKIEIVSGDIRDPFETNLSVKGCDSVINLAALIGIPYSYKAPKNYVDTNIIGTVNILEAARKNDVKKIILTSTSEVYGSAQQIPIKENHPLNAQSPYAATKIASDFMGLSYYFSYKTPVILLRPFNTFGPRQTGRAIIPSILLQVMKDQKVIKLGNLLPTRDFVYVDDTVDAFVNALKSKKKLYGNVFNICSGREVSVGKICQIIKKITKKNFVIEVNKERVRAKSSEVNRLLGDNSKAKKYLNWKPRYASSTGFLNGLKKTIEWFSKNENLSKYKKIYNI